MSKFKVGDKVRCVSPSGALGVEVGSIYTVKNPQLFKSQVHEDVYCMELLEVRSSPYDKNFELVQEDHVLTPEEVFEHLRKGTELQHLVGTYGWKDVTTPEELYYTDICSEQFRIKPVPKIIEANGRKYKLIEE